MALANGNSSLGLSTVGHVASVADLQHRHQPAFASPNIARLASLDGEAVSSGVDAAASSSSNGHAVTEDLEWDDAAWVLCSTFIIFTMQTGFGLLESGIVSLKNQVNIMMKNFVDVVLGGLTFWAFGYGLTFGDSEYATPFYGSSLWFLSHASDFRNKSAGLVFTNYLFNLSFATTATTIVSGAMAERCNFTAYCLFSLVNTVVYCIPAHWLWAPIGFLSQLGAVDVAGSGGVHLVGGVSAFVAANVLGPRLGRWDFDDAPPMGSPTNALVGLFMLWWGWLGFNSSSTFGVTGHKWRLAARAAFLTMMASLSGGLVAMVMSYVQQKRKIDVLATINGILGALASITAGCFLVTVWEALIIGAVGAFLANITDSLMIRLRVDDAVGATRSDLPLRRSTAKSLPPIPNINCVDATTSVHGFGGAWGMLSVGLFATSEPLYGFSAHDGLLHGGGFYLLGVQCLAVVSLAAWSAVSTFVLLKVINIVVPVRVTDEEELLGADYHEHEIYTHSISRYLAVLRQYHAVQAANATTIPPTADVAHDEGVNKLDEAHRDYITRRYSLYRVAAEALTSFRRHNSGGRADENARLEMHETFDAGKKCV